jgi:hypothetical protein
LKFVRLDAEFPTSAIVDVNDPREVLPYCWARFTHLFRDQNTMKFVNKSE